MFLDVSVYAMQGPGFSELDVRGGWGQTTQEVQQAQDSGNEDPT